MVAEPYTACTAIQNDVSGKVVLIGRGGCTFANKAVAAQNAGAVGVIIVNDDEANPNTVRIMDDGDTGTSAAIPVLMVSYNGGTQIRNLGTGISVKISSGRHSELRNSCDFV